MTLKSYPDLHSFLSKFMDSDPETDEKTARAYVAAISSGQQRKIGDQLQLLLKNKELSVEDLGAETNRWFSNWEDARSWLIKIQAIFEAGLGTEVTLVKDSNGVVLSEGDSVIVVKDLKVKGGSSDLKRGTVIKKIHLTDDTEVIECRVDGSTLVLKTCFLKKS